MSYQEPLSQTSVAISISESSDMAVLGLAEEHLRDAMAEVARHLLAMGARLIYGGDLRAYGFTELLFELVARHRRDADLKDERPGVVSYLPWPVHSSKTASDIQALAKDLAGIAEVHCLDRQGQEIPLDRLAPEPRSPTDEEWTDGLTAMRRLLSKAADARVVLGGRVTGYKGRMPGIAEEDSPRATGRPTGFSPRGLRRLRPRHRGGPEAASIQDLAGQLAWPRGIQHLRPNQPEQRPDGGGELDLGTNRPCRRSGDADPARAAEARQPRLSSEWLSGTRLTWHS